MNDKQPNKIGDVFYVMTIIIASFAIVMGFLALVGKVVMNIFS